MRTRTLLAVIGLAACIAGCGQNVGFLVRPIPADQSLTESEISRDDGLFVVDKIAIVDVDGLIMNQTDGGLFGTGENPVSLFIEKLDKAAADPYVKAVVIRINSPGGGVTASDIMHRKLVDFRESRKVPVVAIIEDVGASGGYYIACGAGGADASGGAYILAHPTSVTGSIGVIVQTMSFAGTMEKIGITAEAVTSGPRKDMGSPLKPIDPADVAILQQIVDDFHGRFVNVVDAARPGLDAAQVRALADGRVYTGDQAAANGLVDGLGYMDDAIALARAKAGVKAARVVMYHRPWGAKSNAYSRSALPMQVNLLNISIPDALAGARPQFLYLWTGKN